MDDLRREFEAYRTHGGLAIDPGAPILGRVSSGAPATGEIAIEPYSPAAGVPEVEPTPSATEEEGVVVFRPGMTMEDMEREAISAALERVRGNRRRAAELLGIGERTLYRKIAKYELDNL